MGSNPPLGWRVDPNVVERFRQFVTDDLGKSSNKLANELENAMREYIEGGQGGRIEETVRENQEKLEEVLTLLQDDPPHAHTSATSSGKSLHSLTQPEKTDILVDHLDREFDDALSTQELETAIEEAISVGGRTQSDYKDRLKQRGALFADPREDVDVWFRSQEDFFERVRAHTATTRLSHQDLLEEYDQSLLPAYKDWLKDELAAAVPDRFEPDDSDPDPENAYPVSTSRLDEAIATTARTDRWVTEIRQRIRDQGILEETERGWAPTDWSPSDVEETGTDEGEANTEERARTETDHLATQVAHTILDDRDAWPAETAYIRAIVRRETDREGEAVDAIIEAIDDQDILAERAADEWVPRSTAETDDCGENSAVHPTRG